MSDCEQVRTPSLCGLPVGVLGNQGACVIAKSYEMKRMGVGTGIPIWDALALCPDGIYVKRDFRWYEVISRQLLSLLHEVSPVVEYYSIDEMFFDAAELPKVFSKPLPEAARCLQRRVLDEVGIPVSVGISSCKTLAKIGSDAAKPFGCSVLFGEDEIRKFLHDQPVEEMSGIGHRNQRKLAAQGILTCWDFHLADRAFIRKLLTVMGEKLWWELHGDSVIPIVTKRPPHKIISRGGSLGEATADPERLTAWLVRNVERLIEELDFYQVFTERITLELGYKEGRWWCDSATMPEPTARFEIIVPMLKGLLEKSPHGLVSRMHLLADRLCFRHLVQPSLFHQPNDRADLLAETKRIINEKIGRFAVRSAETLPLKEIYDDQTHQHDICDVHGKMCF